MKAPNKDLFTPSFLFKSLVVSKISVSTEYPIIIRNATIPAVESFIPTRFTTAKVITMSAKAENITAKAGSEFLIYILIKSVANVRKITADIIGLIVRKNLPRKNPNIIKYEFDEWLWLPRRNIEEGNGDFGGIWTARTPGGARMYQKYMMEKYDQETLAFKSLIGKVLSVNSGRVKTNGIRLIEKLNLM